MKKVFIVCAFIVCILILVACDGVLKYEGGFSRNGTYDVYSGMGKLFDYKGDVVFEGEFANNKPIDVAGFKNDCQKIEYDELARNPNKYIGKLVKLEATISQVIELTDDYVKYIVAVNNNYDTVAYLDFFRLDSEPRILENDKVDIYGVSEGLITYESISGASVTVPAISAMFIVRK